MSTNTFTEAQRQRLKSNMDGAINTMREAVAMSERRLHSAKHDGITGPDIGREAYALVQGLANAMSSINSAMDAREMELQARVHELESALGSCLSYLADLNGSDWITGDHPDPKDMRQRAKALRQVAIDALGARSLFGPGTADATAAGKPRPVVMLRHYEKRGHGGQQTRYAVSIECGDVFGTGDVRIFPMLHAGYGSTSDISDHHDALLHAEKVAISLGLKLVKGCP